MLASKSSEQLLVLLLSLDERFLEQVGICTSLSVIVYRQNSGQLTLTVAEPDGKSLCFWFALANICRHVPDPAAVAANVGR